MFNLFLGTVHLIHLFLHNAHSLDIWPQILEYYDTFFVENRVILAGDIRSGNNDHKVIWMLSYLVFRSILMLFYAVLSTIKWIL